MIWDIIVLIAILITLIVLPVDIAFFTNPAAHGSSHGTEHGDDSGHKPDHGHADQNTVGPHRPVIFGPALYGNQLNGTKSPNYNSEYVGISGAAQEHQVVNMGDHSTHGKPHTGLTAHATPETLVVLGSHMTRGRYIWFMSNFVCELFFMLDILLDFRTAYIDDETEQVRH